MKEESQGKLKKLLDKLLSMKDLLLIALILIAAVAYAIISTFEATGFFMTSGYAVSGEQIVTNLTDGSRDPVELVEIQGDDTVYSRWGKIYHGDKKKTKLNTEYPMVLSGGSAVRFLDTSAVLYDSDFNTEQSYDGLILSEGNAFNLDGSSAGLGYYPFVRLSNGLVLNSGEMEVETVLNLYRIPANSFLLMGENQLDYYTFQEGKLIRGGEVPDISLVATVRIGDLEMSWQELLEKLGLYKEPAEITEAETEGVSEETEPGTEGSLETALGEGESDAAEGDDGSFSEMEQSGEGQTLEGGSDTDRERDDEEADDDDSDIGSGRSGDEGDGGDDDDDDGSGGGSGKSSGGGKKGQKGSAGADPAEPDTPEVTTGTVAPTTSQRETETGTTQIPTTDVPPETKAPTKGGKIPAAPSDKPAGAKENLDWKDPSVTVGSVFNPGIYTLKTSVIINDPAGVIVSGINYEIVIMDEYGKMTLFKRVSVKQEEAGKEMTVLISGLKPNSTYSITGTYRYRDKYGVIVKESRTFLETKQFETKDVSALGAIKLEDLELDQALPKSNYVTLPHLKCTEESDQDAIGSLAKATVRFNEGKANAKGVNMTNTQLSKLKSYQAISFNSNKDLDSSTSYTVDIVCYDMYYNQLRVEDPYGKSQWTVNTCYQTPNAEITVKLNNDDTVSITTVIGNKDNLPYTDLKMYVNSNTTGKMVRLNTDYPEEDERSTWLEITSGQTVTIPSPGNNAAFTVQVWCTCDPKDGFGNQSRQIGAKRFTTSRIDELGAVYVTAKDITDATIEAEAETCATEKEQTAKLAEKSTRIVVSLTLNKEETNPVLCDPDMVNDFTVKFAAGEENHQISLTEDERTRFLAGETITIDTNDKVRFPWLTGLTSNTTYSMTLGATHWYDDTGTDKTKIVVITSLGKIKTDIRNVEVTLDDPSVAFFEGFISMNIKITDLDGVIDGEYAILRIEEKDTGAAVGAWKIQKNQNDWYELRLKSSGSEAYDIKADTTYVCTFIAEEAHTEQGYQTYYVLRKFERGTGKSLTGSVYSLGLTKNDPEDGNYTAKLGYELNVPEGEDVSEAFRNGVIYVDEFRNTKDAEGNTVKTKVETIPISFTEEGLHPSTTYVSAEKGSSVTYTESELKAELAKGDSGRVKKYSIPDQYVLCEYIENLGKSYIDTEYNPDGDTGVEADVHIKSYLSSYGTVFGVNSGSWSGKSYAAFFGGSSWTNYNNNFNLSIGNIYGKRYRMERKVETVGATRYSRFYIDGTRRANDGWVDYSSILPMYLCAMNWGGGADYYIRQKIYSFRVYEDQNGNGNDQDELVREYLPCYDTESETYGLYETVERKFYGNSASTGSFTGRQIASRYYWVDDNGKQVRLMEQEEPCTLSRQVAQDANSSNTYSYEMYFVYGEGTSYETKVQLANISFSTEQEILTIASGEEFVTKGANAKKYVVINDISYDNRDCTSNPLNSLKANIDFQGFSFETWTNYYTIVNTSTKTASVTNMVLKSHACLMSVAGANTSSWDSGKYYRGGMLFTTFYGTARNLYIEFSQDEFPFVYNPSSAYTYWSTLSPSEMEALPDDDTRNKYKYRVQPTVASFVCDNYGTIENFVIDLQTEIAGDNWVGGLACANVSGGVIRNGYVFSSVGASFGDYTGKMTLYYGYYAGRGYSTEGAMGGIVGYVNTNATVENCYAVLDMETYCDAEISRHVGAIVGMTTGSTGKVRNSYMTGDVYLNYTDSEGTTMKKVYDAGYGPACGRIYSGGKPQNLFYISDYMYSNTVNTQLSTYALKSKVWQNNILNTNSGFNTDKLVDVGYFPQVAFTSEVMPIQKYIPLPTYSLTQKNTDVAYSYEQKDTSKLSAAAREKLDPVMSGTNYGNEAWDSTGQYYDSNEQVACVLLAESDETRVVYSMEVEHFNLTHEDILYQYKDGTGIIQVYVRLHNPDMALSQYKITKIVYEGDSGAPGDIVNMSGARYINADFYKQIWREEKAEGADSWEAMVKKYGTSTFQENLVLKADLDFAGTPLTSVLVRGEMDGKVNGSGHTISNIVYDSNIAGTFSLSSVSSGMGLFNDLYGDVWDLTLENVQLEAGGDTGALCAHLYGAGLDHVFVVNSYISGGRLLGGIAGILDGGDVVDCGVSGTKLLHNRGDKYSSASSEGKDYFTGGIAGQASGAKLRRSYVQNCYLESMYVDFNTATGGLIGYLTDSYSYVDNCYATGVINSNNDFTGGLIGAARGSLMSFSSCYSDMDLYAWTYRTEQTVGLLSSGEIPSSVISFGTTQLAGIYERTETSHTGADERTANMHPRDYKSSLGYDEYLNGQVFNYLSSEYFVASGAAEGILPQLRDGDGTLLPYQENEYVGAEYGKVSSGNTGINVDPSSLQVTKQSDSPLASGENYKIAGDTYSLSLTVHHSADITIRNLYYGFTYVDETCGMSGKTGKLPSFTDTAVLTAVGGRSLDDTQNDNTTTITCYSLKTSVAYDRYFLTGIEYSVEGEDPEVTHVQRVGLELTEIGQHWTKISGISDWKSKLYGSHCENFKVTGDVDFAGETVSFQDNTANNVVNRLVGDLGASAEYLSYQGTGGKASGTNPYRTIRNLKLDDTGYSTATGGFWQRLYCRGLIGVVNSEMGCLTFEDITVTGKYNTFGVIGAMTGNAHQLNLNRVTINANAQSANNYAGFIAYLKDGIDRVYMNACTMNAKGRYTGILVGYLHHYTHNNLLKDITAEYCTVTNHYNSNTAEVGTGVVLGYCYRYWGLKCNYTTEYTATAHMENVTVTDSTVTSDGYSVGAVAGELLGIIKNCTVKRCNVTTTGYIAGGLAGTGTYFHADGITVEDTTVKGSGQVGAVTGRTLYYDGYYWHYNVYINNSTIKNCEVLGNGSLTSDSYLWYVGGITGYLRSSSHSNGLEGNTVENCTITGRSGMVGGLAGFYDYSSRVRLNTVKNCKITGKSEIGGLYGGSNDGYTSFIEGNTVTDCEMVGSTHVGGLVGYGGQPYRSNRVEDCTIVGTEYNVGGAVGYLSHGSYDGQKDHYSRQNDGTYAVLVKNCSIYGRFYVGGAAGTISRVGMPTSIVEDCEVRGYTGVGGILGRVYHYGTAGASNQIYRYAYDCSVQDTLITEMDETANSDLLTKYGVNIEETTETQYFGGGIGYAGTLYYCLVDHCMIAAPNAKYVGGLQGYYRVNWYSDYADSRYSVCRNSVVIGKDYVGGLYGAIKSAYNYYFLGENKLVTASYSYSNASVTGENHVGGIAGLYAADGGQGETNKTYNPVLKNVYFTGTLEATGTAEGSGIASAVIADQAVDPNFNYPAAKEYLRLDGVLSMPASITGKTVYPLIREDAAYVNESTQSSESLGLDYLKAGNQYAFVTLWKGTQITLKQAGGETNTTMGDLLAGTSYSGITFEPKDYASYINTSNGNRIAGTDHFVMVLESTYDAQEEVYKKALRANINKGYSREDADFGNITAADSKNLMPLTGYRSYPDPTKKTRSSGYVLPFGSYSLTINGEAFSLKQGVDLPGTAAAANTRTVQNTEKTDYQTTGTWSGGTTDVEKVLASMVKFYSCTEKTYDTSDPSVVVNDPMKLTIEFDDELYTKDLGGGVTLSTADGEQATFTTRKGDEGSYSSVSTGEQGNVGDTGQGPVIPNDGYSHAWTYNYNFMDSLTVNLKYTLSNGREGILGIRVEPGDVSNTVAGGYSIRNGDVIVTATEVTKLSKAAISTYQLPSGYKVEEYVTLDGNQGIDTGVRAAESEVYLDFALSNRNGNMFVIGRNFSDHEFLITFNSSGNGFGYFGNGLRNNYSYGTGLAIGTRYTLHTVGLTGNLAIELKTQSQTGFSRWYTNTGYNAYLGFTADGTNESIWIGKHWSNAMQGRIYGCRIYSNGKLVRDYVPCTNAESVAGLYDLVGKTFYKSQGSKAFATGGVTGGLIERGDPAYIRLYKDGSKIYALDSYGRSTEVQQ